jgi:1-acyl-sn-glycerol-3-phosphate acyltransferase
MVSPFYFILGALSIPPFRLLYRLRASGQENLPESGGYVLSANHLSNVDPWPLGLPLWPKRQIRFMAKSELFRPPLRPILELAGAFQVRRGYGDDGAIKTAVDFARDGNVVAIFPEGTRREKGLARRRRPRPHTGAARIALEAEVPLIPAAIAGTDRLTRFARLRVVYGPAVELGDLGDLEIRKAARVATDRLMTAIGELESTL